MPRRVTISHPAPAGARFTADAFDRQIGKRLRFTIDGRTVDDCVVVAVEVHPTGAVAAITLDLPDR